MTAREEPTDATYGGYALRRRRWRPRPSAPPSAVAVRDVNERLLIAGLREQELAAALEIERATLEAERAALEIERAQLAMVLAGIGDAVLVVDGAGTPMRTNAAYARLFGGVPYAPEDAQGRPLPQTETPRARAARGETFSLEFSLTATDGTRRWFEANGQPLHEHGAEHAVVVIRDITLSAQHRHLQDEFLSLASHELRTPLTSVQGYLDLLLTRVQHTGDDERTRRYATQAQGQMRRLVALVRDLTDVARLQSGKLTLDVDPLDLAALVAGVVETARDLPPGHTIHLDAGVVPLRVRGDAGRLEQVLFNLLTNAFVHAPSVAPIDVRLRQEGADVALEVQDHGRGIAADQLPHLFSRFYQVARPDRPSQAGLGLGLFICQELVAAHGGRIAVTSTEGEGTTFTVWLPLLEEKTDSGNPRPL